MQRRLAILLILVASVACLPPVLPATPGPDLTELTATAPKGTTGAVETWTFTFKMNDDAGPGSVVQFQYDHLWASVPTIPIADFVRPFEVSGVQGEGSGQGDGFVRFPIPAGHTFHKGDVVTFKVRDLGNPRAAGDHLASMYVTNFQYPMSGVVRVRISASDLPTLKVAAADPKAGASTSYTFQFTTVNPWPADGALEIALPAGFDASGATATLAGADGVLEIHQAGSTVHGTRGQASGVAGGAGITLTLSKMRNPGQAVTTPTFDLRTLDVGGAAIDSGSAAGPSITAAVASATLPVRREAIPTTGSQQAEVAAPLDPSVEPEDAPDQPASPRTGAPDLVWGIVAATTLVLIAGAVLLRRTRGKKF